MAAPHSPRRLPDAVCLMGAALMAHSAGASMRTLHSGQSIVYLVASLGRPAGAVDRTAAAPRLLVSMPLLSGACSGSIDLFLIRFHSHGPPHVWTGNSSGRPYWAISGIIQGRLRGRVVLSFLRQVLLVACSAWTASATATQERYNIVPRCFVRAL